MSLIRIEGLNKWFGQRQAVAELELDVPEGEIFGLLGHNGAGKSTLIGMLLGQVWPTSGSLRVCGHDVTRHRERALREVGAIFETPVFYDYMTGYRNLQIMASYTASTPRQRLLEVIEWVGLAGREQHKVKTYSHGMRARLALAQALLPRPRLLILDEPSDGLDPEGIHEMRLTIQRLRRDLGLTILLSSHLLNEVEQLCTRIAIMNRGRKVFEGAVTGIADSHQWIELRVDDFERAAAWLRERELITATREGGLVAARDGGGVAEIVRALVEAGFAVHGCMPRERTLESFYLELMHAPGGAAAPEAAKA